MSDCGPLSRCARSGHVDALDHGPDIRTRQEAIRAERAADAGYSAPGETDWREQTVRDVEEIAAGETAEIGRAHV